MTKRCREGVTVVANGAQASFRFADGTRLDVAPEVLSKSSLLRQALPEMYKGSDPIHLDTPSGFVKSWLQWVRQENPSGLCDDAQQLVQYLLVRTMILYRTCLNYWVLLVVR